MNRSRPTNQSSGQTQTITSSNPHPNSGGPGFTVYRHGRRVDSNPQPHNWGTGHSLNAGSNTQAAQGQDRRTLMLAAIERRSGQSTSTQQQTNVSSQVNASQQRVNQTPTLQLSLRQPQTRVATGAPGGDPDPSGSSTSTMNQPRNNPAPDPGHRLGGLPASNAEEMRHMRLMRLDPDYQREHSVANRVPQLQALLQNPEQRAGRVNQMYDRQDGGHGHGRHGGQTTTGQHDHRILTGQRPDGSHDHNYVWNSSHYNNQQEQLATRHTAINQFRQNQMQGAAQPVQANGNLAFNVQMGANRNTGVRSHWNAGGGGHITHHNTNRATVVMRPNGRMVTDFPE